MTGPTDPGRTPGRTPARGLAMAPAMAPVMAPAIAPAVRRLRLPRPLRRAPVLLVAWVLALVLGGCVSIPTAGPVAEGDGAVDEPGSVFPLAYSPPSDASPTAIV